MKLKRIGWMIQQKRGDKWVNKIDTLHQHQGTSKALYGAERHYTFDYDDKSKLGLARCVPVYVEDRK